MCECVGFACSALLAHHFIRLWLGLPIEKHSHLILAATFTAFSPPRTKLSSATKTKERACSLELWLAHNVVGLIITLLFIWYTSVFNNGIPP